MIFNLFQFNLCLPSLKCSETTENVFFFSTRIIRKHETHWRPHARPTTDILVSNDIHLGTLEAVFDLDNNTWDFPYTPETTIPQHIADHGIEEATHILHYFSEVVHKRETILGDLPAGLKQVLRDIENHYLAHLPYPGGTPAEATAGTTASIERETAAKDDAINRVVREVYANAKQQQKLRVEAKPMPKEHPVPETPAASSYNITTGQRTTSSRSGATGKRGSSQEGEATTEET